jgi:hypothetical protein
VSAFLFSVFGSSFSFFVYTGVLPYSDVFGLSFGEIRLGVYLYVVVPEEVAFFVGSCFGPEVFKRDLSAFLSEVRSEVV